MKHYISFFFLSFLLINIHGQFYESGQDPASIRWKQIKTTNFQIIFPSTSDSIANRLANNLEFLYVHVANSLNCKPKKISVILHPYTSKSNGFVTLAPRRMELFTTPPQDTYGQDWIDQLAIHELRHVVQIDKLNQGFTQIIGILFGSQAKGAVAGLIPLWFYEGDAVNTETILTKTGRGRMGNFTMEMKALIMQNPKPFSFEKMVLGSYKDYIPNQYNFGYTMVSYNYALFNDSLFSNNLRFTGRNPYYPFAFNKSFVNQTKLSDKKIYAQTIKGLNKIWSTNSLTNKYTPNKIFIKKKNKTYTSYRFPVNINDTTIFSIKSGIDQRKQFILLYKNGKEKVLYTPGIYNNDRISLRQNTLVWAEETPDIRWSNKSYSNIYKLDIFSGKVKMLTRKTRYSAPALSPDLNKIAVVHVSIGNKISLALLNANNGSVINEIPSPGNVQVKDPVWEPNGESVIVVLSGKKGQALSRLNLTSETWEDIIPWSFQNLSMPVVSDSIIYYSSDINGTNNIYAFHLNSQKTSTITDSQIGAFEPNFYEKDTVLYYSEYTSHGFNLYSLKITSDLLTNFKSPEILEDALVQKNSIKENFNFQDSIIPAYKYEIKRYSRLAHTINFHSWAPFYMDYNNLQFDGQSLYPGFILLSQDKLSTCVGSVGISYENNRPVYRTNFTYKGWFPVIGFSMEYGDNNPVASIVQPNSLPSSTNYRTITNTNIYIPLNLSEGNIITSVIPHFNWKYDNQKFYNRETDSYVNQLNILSGGINFYSYTRLSYKDLAPRNGFTFYSEYFLKPLNQNVVGTRYYLKSRIYLPGVAKHHSLQISGGYFSQEVKDYRYKSSISYPRGYITDYPSKLKAFTVDYSMPLGYPDLHIGRLFYLKRIRTNLFADWAQADYHKPTRIIGNYATNSSYSYSSGIDITTDSHILRILFPISMGIRTVYMPQIQSLSSYFIFGIDFVY